MKKSFMPVFLFALLFVAASANAQIRWGARIGMADGEPLVGGEMIFKVSGSLYFNPNIEFSSDLVTTNADAHYDIEISRDAALWVGAGIALINPEGQDLDVGVNLLGGLGRRYGRYIMYIQGKLVTPSDYDNYASLALGVRF